VANKRPISTNSPHYRSSVVFLKQKDTVIYYSPRILLYQTFLTKECLQKTTLLNVNEKYHQLY